MPFHEAKKKLSKEEIIEILKKNVALYRNEKEFVNYIVELAMYLIECEYDKSLNSDAESEHREGMPTFTFGAQESQKFTPENAGKVYKVLKSYVPRSEDHHCHLCGAPTGGKRKCPNCGNMT